MKNAYWLRMNCLFSRLHFREERAVNFQIGNSLFGVSESRTHRGEAACKGAARCWAGDSCHRTPSGSAGMWRTGYAFPRTLAPCWMASKKSLVTVCKREKDIWKRSVFATEKYRGILESTISRCTHLGEPTLKITTYLILRRLGTPSELRHADN